MLNATHLQSFGDILDQAVFTLHAYVLRNGSILALTLNSLNRPESMRLNVTSVGRVVLKQALRPSGVSRARSSIFGFGLQRQTLAMEGEGCHVHAYKPWPDSA